MKILIVDDAKVVVSLIQVYCADWPVKVDFVVAGDGEEGLSMAREHRPDVVISDVKMPRMDGFELTAALRMDEHFALTPVVLLSFNDDEASRKKGELVGANAFLRKPVSPEDLKSTLGKLLNLSMG